MGKSTHQVIATIWTKIYTKKIHLIKNHINLYLLIWGAGKIRAARTGPWRTEKSSCASPLICKTHAL